MTINDALLDLFRHGHQAGTKAYAPYSQYKVGAAIKTGSGEFFAGCNAETANYKGTCAEAGAIAAMVAAGQRLIESIAVVGPGNDLCSPCGDCRQRIREFSGPETSIHVFANNGTLLKSYTIDQLLPDGFGPHNLSAHKS